MTTLPVSDLLKVHKPREYSGSQTAGRYAFQANYGILKLVELRESSQDFRVVFDLFDDLMVLDCSHSPQEMRFYQLKSKDPGDWTCANVCSKIGQAKPRSIVSRLYSHVHQFGAVVVETSMVSNAPFRLKLRDGTTTSGTHHRIVGSDLHGEEIAKVAKAVQDDISPSDIPQWLPRLAFIRTTLGVHGQQLVVIVRLQQHIETLGGGEGIKTSALYQTLYASIEHRTSYSEERADAEALMLRKSLSRSDLDELIERAISRRRGILEDWALLQADFNAGGVGSRRQIQLKTAVIACLRDRGAGRASVIKLSEAMRLWAKDHQAEVEACTAVLDLAQLLRNAAAGTAKCSEIELEAASLVEAYEVSHDAA
ncbi:MAG: dsDNA nuclease domain-containing protein [Hyphomicrobiaceae bacterium]